MRTNFLGLVAVLLAILASGCQRKESPRLDFDPAACQGLTWVPGGPRDGRLERLDSLVDAIPEAGDLPPIRFEYPFQRTIFPPGFTPPMFSWSDSSGRADFWILEGAASNGFRFRTLTTSPELPPARLDSSAIPQDGRMEIPDPNRFRNWRPSYGLWDSIQSASPESPFVLEVYGIDVESPEAPASYGRLEFTTSRDSVGAPVFYRDVPILPTRNVTGKVQPLTKQAERLIQWRLKDVTRPGDRTLIRTLPTCANCHSFSKDGKTIGLDLDGPQNDKGTYGLAELRRVTDISRRDAFSWNEDFEGREKGRHTIGFLSSVSPDGEHVVTTVNEQVYIHNYLQNRYIQVFFPTRGILAFRSRKTGRIKPLPGADDTAFVHCDPVWSPDGKHIVFARARAKDPYHEGQPDPLYPNDPNETQIQYDLYRIPFNGGRGGKAEPVAGASANGMSNNFPKVSPDGRFIVFVKCRNGQLLRPDSRLWIVPFEGGEARLMDCNLPEMNSWHSFSPSGRWMVFSSKGMSWYTRMFLTHIDEQGNDSPPVLIEDATAANRAVNLPEFVNAPYDSLERIDVSAIDHLRSLQEAYDLLRQDRPGEAKAKMEQALREEREDRKFRSEVQVLLAWLQDSIPGRIGMIREAIRTYPRNSLAHFNLASLLEREGRIEEAVESYLESVALDSNNAWGLVSLARIHMQSAKPGIRDIGKAIALAQQANRLSKYREPSIFKTLARAYSEAGRFGEAIRTAGTGLELARQQGLPQEIRELEVEMEVYRLGKSFTWALENSRNP